MSTHTFDDSNIQWNRLGDFEHLHYSLLNVDEERGIADVLFKFAANEQIVLHRHLAKNNTFVIQGEHRLYKSDGTIKEIRSVGSMTSSPPNEEPHREGGGDQDVIIAFSIRGRGVLYELLNDDMKVVGTISMQDFVDLKNAERTAGG
jgi:quercetin dioxygenase-like cupin family protein